MIALVQALIDDFKINQTNKLCDIKLYPNIEKQQNENFFLIEADKARISQVISNLLCNAVKFTNNDCS